MQPIKFNSTVIENLVNLFKEKLTKGHTSYTSAGSVSYNISAKSPIPIQLNYSAMAYLKMRTLVDTCDKEIAWQGVVHTNEEHTRFDVVDILVYPQVIAAATVDMDEEAYEPWHQALSNEQYNNLRLQGHSHVNMATNPSGVDTNMYDELLNVIREDSYYIFMITNKKQSYWYRIFDKKNNVVYDNSDIVVTIDNVDLQSWYKSITELFVKNKTYTYTSYGSYSQGSFYSGNNFVPEYYRKHYNQPAPPVKGKDYIGDVAPVGFDDYPDEDLLPDELTDPFAVVDDPQTVAQIINQSKPNTTNNQKGKK